MKIDLTCPVELWQYAMPTGDDEECTFVMNNLSDKVVTSVQVTLACYDKEDLLLFRQTERVQGLKAGAGERFSVLLLPSQWKDVDGVDLVVEKVWFDDATIWRRSGAPLTQYTSNALPGGRALDQLRFAAGKDAVGYPQQQEQVWMCVCGRANPTESQRCCRCERRKESVFASYSRENVEAFIAVHEQKLAEAAKKAREESSLLIENREKQKLVRRRRRAKTLRLLLSGLCIVAVIAVAIIWGVPTIRYNLAADKLEHGAYDEARAAFAAMGDYRDAGTQIVECDYQQARSQLAAGDEDNLRLAMAGFEALADYKESPVLWQEAAYELGVHAIDGKRYEDAAELFEQLGDYEDSKAKLNEATYLQADALLIAGRYDIAKALFDGLGAYSDAAVKSMTCVYQRGRALFEAEDYAGAAQALSPLGEFENAADLVKQSNYQLAEAKLADGELQGAGELYLLAGDYQNAADKANDCLYQYAQQLKASGDYQRASEVFAQISGYLDSEGQVALCMYQQASALADTGDYAGAAALLEAVTGNEEATQLLYRCNYELAMAAIESGDDQSAERLLENVDQYEDSERQLRMARYRLAEADLEAKRYQSAFDRYTALGTYRDSRTKARQCSYQLALALMAAGEYQQAADAFTALGDYQDSELQLQEATYRLALSSSESGDTQQAASLLDTIPEHQSAAETLTALKLAEGQALEDAGDYAGASELYLAMGDDPTAKERYNACQYALARQLMQSGDLMAASAVFVKLGDYQDSAALAAECADSVYGAAAVAARAAYERSEYAAAASALDGLELSALPTAYEDLLELYQSACYQRAEQLYRDGKPYEALPYYQRITDYRDVSSKKLTRRAYLILGDWRSSTGREATFRADGTCDIMGEALYFRVSNFSLYTGATPDAMTVTHKLSTIGQTSMSLRDIRDGNDIVYKMERVADAAVSTPIPLPQVSPAPQASDAPEATDSADDMLVQED